MLTPAQNLAENLRNLRGRIASAAVRYGRDVDSVTLLAASKSQPAAAIREIAQLGQRDFGENYLQEALPKLDALAGLELIWHFIGPLQSNKTRPVAERFAWVHGVDRLRIAERLSAQRPALAPPLNVCLQVRLGREPGKSGVEPAELPALAAAVRELPRLSLRGLMTLPPPETDFDRQRRWFAELRRLRDDLVARGFSLDTLSMGMSADMEAAIAEGSTCVRIGTALFGPRPPRAEAY